MPRHIGDLPRHNIDSRVPGGDPGSESANGGSAGRCPVDASRAMTPDLCRINLGLAHLTGGTAPLRQNESEENLRNRHFWVKMPCDLWSRSFKQQRLVDRCASISKMTLRMALTLPPRQGRVLV